MTKDSKKNVATSSWLVGDAFVIACITALGYVSTYIVNISYLQYFGLPIGLVTIPATEVIIASMFIFAAAISCALVSKPIYRILVPKKDKEENNEGRAVWSMFIAYLMPYLVIRIILLREISLPIIIQFAFVIIFSWIEVIILTHWAKSHRKKDKEYERRWSDIMFLGSHLEDYLEGNTRIAGILFVLFFIVVLIFSLSADAGTSAAQFKTTFSIINGTSTPLAIIVQSGDVLVAAPLDENNQLVNQIHLMNIDTLNENGLYLSQENIGPVKPLPQPVSFWRKWLGPSFYTWESNGVLGF